MALGEDKPPSPVAESWQATLKGTRSAHRLEADAVMRATAGCGWRSPAGSTPARASSAWSGRVESLSLTGRGALRARRADSARRLREPRRAGRCAAARRMGRGAHRGDALDAEDSRAQGLEPRHPDPEPGARRCASARCRARTWWSRGDWDVRGAESFDGSVNVRRVSGDLRVGEPPLPLGLQRLELKATASGGRAQATLEIAGERIGRVQGEGAATHRAR